MSLGLGALLGAELPPAAGRDGSSLTGGVMPPNPRDAAVMTGIILDAVADLHEALTRAPTEEEKREAQQRERDKLAKAHEEDARKAQEIAAQEVLERLGPNALKIFTGIRGLPVDQRLEAIRRLMASVDVSTEESPSAGGLPLSEGKPPLSADLAKSNPRRADKKIIGTIILDDIENAPDMEDRRKGATGSVTLASGEAKLAFPLGEGHAPRITITSPIVLDNYKQGKENFGSANVILEYPDGRSTSFTEMRLMFSKDATFKSVENPDELSSAA